MGMGFGGLLGLLVLAADIWAVINVVGSQRTPVEKTLWVILILALPIIGLVLWLLAGPRSKS